jgi:hypothetical protein
MERCSVRPKGSFPRLRFYCFPHSGVNRFFSYPPPVILSLLSPADYFPAAHRNWLSRLRFPCLKGVLFLNP